MLVHPIVRFVSDHKPKTKATGTKPSSNEEERDTITRDATPRVKQLAEFLDQVRSRKGLTRGELSRRTGIHRTNVSNFLNKKEGVGADRALRYIDALGLVIRDSEIGAPIPVGAIGPGAMLILDAPLSFPCTARVAVAFGTYQVDDVLHLAASATFDVGKWLLIERGTTRVFAFADDRPGAGRVLTMADGDALLYDPERHKIIARVYGYFREE